MENIIEDLEGVIKYHLHHQPMPIPASVDISELNAWRHLLYRLSIIGQDDNRYQGLAYGNISQRLADTNQFIISGTQTSGLPHLQRQNYALITVASPQQNTISSIGLTAPSSEALTHAMVYQKQTSAQAVIHVHCPEIWQHTQRLQLLHTAADVAYGTVEMALAVADLLNDQRIYQKPLFCMLGHQDGVVAFGATLSQAANVLINQLAEALALE